MVGGIKQNNYTEIASNLDVRGIVIVRILYTIHSDIASNFCMSEAIKLHQFGVEP